MAQPSGTDTSAVGEASPGTTLIKLENKTKMPMLPIIGKYFIAPWPILFSSRSATPSDIGLRSSSSITCCVPPGRSTESRARSHRKNTTAKANTSSSMAMWLGMGYCGLLG